MRPTQRGAATGLRNLEGTTQAGRRTLQARLTTPPYTGRQIIQARQTTPPYWQTDYTGQADLFKKGTKKAGEMLAIFLSCVRPVIVCFLEVVDPRAARQTDGATHRRARGQTDGPFRMMRRGVRGVRRVHACARLRARCVQGAAVFGVAPLLHDDPPRNKFSLWCNLVLV